MAVRYAPPIREDRLAAMVTCAPLIGLSRIVIPSACALLQPLDIPVSHAAGRAVILKDKACSGAKQKVSSRLASPEFTPHGR